MSTLNFEVFDSKFEKNVMAHKKLSMTFQKKIHVNLSMCFITYKRFMATFLAFKRDTIIGITLPLILGLCPFVTNSVLNRRKVMHYLDLSIYQLT